MIPLDDIKLQIGEIEKTLAQVREALRPDELQAEVAALEEKMGAPGFWDDVDEANKLNKHAKTLSAKLGRFEKLMRQYDDVTTLLEMTEEAEDESLVPELRTELGQLEKKVEAMQLEQMLKGRYDASDAVLSLHAGAGGTEAQDWTEMLYRMYTR
ncbi:MAG: PCRF domain-containing protein, partial [Clostridia bacterium]|nr:PCRF domain-containing protein [Clostridia bacterium]